MKNIKIIKNRSDIGAGTRGADMGIDAIEIAAINSKNDYFNRFDFEDVKTENEAIYNEIAAATEYKNPYAKRIDSILRQCTRLSEHVATNIKDDNFPIVISGDHSSALGTISGIKAADAQKRVGVIWIDAHADIHSPYTSPSGNIHGMPLAAALANDNLDCQVNEISEETAQLWDKMKQIGVPDIKVQAEDVVYFGVRDTEEPEDKQIDKLGIKNYKVAEVRYRGLETCVNEALSKLSNCDVIYISFDVDAMDCDMVSYGTGTPVPKGFEPEEIIVMIRQIMASKKVACVEFVEVNPLLDFKGNKMAETAFRILEEVTDAIQKLY